MENSFDPNTLMHIGYKTLLSFMKTIEVLS